VVAVGGGGKSGAKLLQRLFDRFPGFAGGFLNAADQFFLLASAYRRSLSVSWPISV